LLCAVLLRLSGMNWLDAVCHAFSVLSLGGFSTHDASIAYFDSPLIEGILIVFMVIAALNFATHFLAWRGRSLMAFFQDAEARAILVLLALSCVGIATYLTWMNTYPDWITSLRHVSFNVVSIATTCGLVSQNYSHWPLFAPLWMLFLSCICASTGSTGGGIKMIRTLLLARQSYREMVTLLHPYAVNVLKIGQQVIQTRVIVAMLGFIFVYFMSIVVFTLLLVASGMDLESALSAVLACINNVGPGLQAVGPASNYAGLSNVQAWVCMLAMLVGRLEVFALLILFTPAFWRK
jgi:trk system potassium uptake protein TrkH